MWYTNVSQAERGGIIVPRMFRGVELDQMNLHVRTDLREALRRYAKEAGRKQYAIVNEALEEYLIRVGALQPSEQLAEAAGVSAC